MTGKTVSRITSGRRSLRSRIGKLVELASIDLAFAHSEIAHCRKMAPIVQSLSRHLDQISEVLTSIQQTFDASDGDPEESSSERADLVVMRYKLAMMERNAPADEAVDPLAQRAG